MMHDVIVVPIVIDVQCFPPGTAVPLISKSISSSTVVGEVVEFSCIFGDNYNPVYYIVRWSVTPLSGDATYIDDSTNIPGFVVSKPQRNCSERSRSCCRFITTLKIHSNMSLNKAKIKCIAFVLEQSTSGTSYLSKYCLPHTVFVVLPLICSSLSEANCYEGT